MIDQSETFLLNIWNRDLPAKNYNNYVERLRNYGR